MKTVEWVGGGDGLVRLIDQSRLPGEFMVLEIRDMETLGQAIKSLQVRGAPAIGVAAAFGLVLGLQALADDVSIRQAQKKVGECCGYLAGTRPTAVNLFWALERMEGVAKCKGIKTTSQLKNLLLKEAQAIRDEDAVMCRAIGAKGAGLIKSGDGVLTHCNAGGLATSEYGTALGVMYSAFEQGKRFHVYVDETRPVLQGARLTAWELGQTGIEHTLICDNMAGHLMSLGKINLVITGADRIAANGDTANKIGTYSLAVLAGAHNIPFYIAAPSSTFDLSIPDGSNIMIEQRRAEEVTNISGIRVARKNVNVYNPAFDITPSRYIKAIITERDIIYSPDTEGIRRLMREAGDK